MSPLLLVLLLLPPRPPPYFNSAPPPLFFSAVGIQSPTQPAKRTMNGLKLVSIILTRCPLNLPATVTVTVTVTATAAASQRSAAANRPSCTGRADRVRRLAPDGRSEADSVCGDSRGGVDGGCNGIGMGGCCGGCDGCGWGGVGLRGLVFITLGAAFFVLFWFCFGLRFTRVQIRLL